MASLLSLMFKQCGRVIFVEFAWKCQTRQSRFIPNGSSNGVVYAIIPKRFSTKYETSRPNRLPYVSQNKNLCQISTSNNRQSVK